MKKTLKISIFSITIGAVKRSDGTSCPGSVVGDFAGLVYNESTRTVSFKVKNLQAGCKLTVGIVTTTPATGQMEAKMLTLCLLSSYFM